MWRRSSSSGRLVRAPVDEPKGTDLISQLPLDLILKIGSSLSHVDVCNLGRCSKFWHEVCCTDCFWFYLTKKKWRLLANSRASFASSQGYGTWMALYRQVLELHTALISIPELISIVERAEVLGNAMAQQ